MPVADPEAGIAFVWVVSSFLFVCISAGGALLLYYMLKPSGDTASWYPYVGVGLVCLPWFFWFITFLYRIFSRILGFRIGDRAAGGGGGGGGKNVQPAKSLKRANTRDVSQGGSGGRHVSFGAARVVDEQEGHGRGLDHDDQDRTDDLKNHGSSTNSSSNDISVRSHESELPLAFSMAS